MDLGFWGSITGIVGFAITFVAAIRGVYVWYKKRKEYTVVDREVTFAWLDSTPLKQGWEGEGFTLGWPLLRDLEMKKSKGWEVMFETDEKKRIKYRFVIRNQPDHILMGKKD